MSEKKTTERASKALTTVAGGPASAVLALVLFGMVNILGARHYRRFDWTRAQLFTLSQRSQQVARNVRDPIEIVVLLGRAEPQWRDAVELAERYRALNPKLTVRTLDPDRQREAFSAFLQRYGLRQGRSSQSDVAAEAGIVIVRGERHLEIRREDLAALGDATRAGGGEASAGERIANARVTVERAISSAIVQIERGDRPTLCISTGHDEVPLEGNDESMQLFTQELAHDNITTRGVELRGTAVVPSDCDALMIAGPRQAFTEGEARSVERYARAGGNLLILLDPFFVDRHHAPSGLESVTRLAGIEPTSTVVVEADPSNLLDGLPPMVFTAGDFGAHEISHNFRGISAEVLVRTARGLRVASGASAMPESLLRSTQNSWAEVGELDAVRDGALRRDSNDIGGPVDLALASTIADARARPGRTANGRVVVFGFSYLVTNESMTAGARARFVSAALLQSAVGWLLERSDLIDVPPKPANTAALMVSAETVKLVRWYALVFVPLAALLVGLAVLRARKSVE